MGGRAGSAGLQLPFFQTRGWEKQEGQRCDYSRCSSSLIAMTASTSHSFCWFFLNRQAKAQEFVMEGLEEGRQ